MVPFVERAREVIVYILTETLGTRRRLFLLGFATGSEMLFIIVTHRVCRCGRGGRKKAQSGARTRDHTISNRALYPIELTARNTDGSTELNSVYGQRFFRNSKPLGHLLNVVGPARVPYFLLRARRFRRILWHVPVGRDNVRLAHYDIFFDVVHAGEIPFLCSSHKRITSLNPCVSILAAEARALFVSNIQLMSISIRRLALLFVTFNARRQFSLRQSHCLVSCKTA
jgi:hypothetical protein